MNTAISEGLIDSKGTAATTTKQSTIILIAWVTTLLMSKLPLVIARDLLGTDIAWITTFWIGTAALLFGGSYFLSILKPLRSYFLIMGLIIVLFFGVEPFVAQSAVWQNLLDGRPEIVRVFGYRLMLLVGSLLVITVLLLMGRKRQEVFLTVGDMKAAAGKRLSWPVFGTIMTLLLGGLFFLFMASQNTAGFRYSALIPWLPLVILAAMVNAFVEETTYRAAPLSSLLSAVGPKHALWMTSLWFGLGHYYGGIPSGPVGLIQSGLVALLLGKAMLDTRGMGWSWIIHVVLDIVIYASIVMASV